MAPPVVLVHRAGGHSGEWADVTAALEERSPGLRVLAVDLPGPGRGCGAPLRSMEAMAGFVAGRIIGLRAGPAVVAGHSMGGAIAMQLALDFPAWAAGLVLVASGAEMRPGRAVMEAIRSGDVRSSPLLGGMAFSPSLPAARREELEARLGRVPVSLLGSDMEAATGFDVRSRLADLTIPVSILAGEDDRMIPLTRAMKLRDLIAGSRLEVLAGVGHMVTWEKPLGVALAISAMIDSVMKAGGTDRASTASGRA